VSIAALSVGAFAAAVAAGALAFNDGLALAKVRSELMEKAVLPPCVRPNIRQGGCEEIGPGLSAVAERYWHMHILPI
jgi:acyl transferase domain-containing protein